MADLPLHAPRALPKLPLPRLLFKRGLQAVVSYEILVYGLAALQAVGLTCPSLVGMGVSEREARSQVAMGQILGAAKQWRADHAEAADASPRADDLAPYLGAWPAAPDDGRFEIVAPGGSLVVGGKLCVVPQGRVAVCFVRDANAVGPYDGMFLEEPKRLLAGQAF